MGLVPFILSALLTMCTSAMIRDSLLFHDSSWNIRSSESISSASANCSPLLATWELAGRPRPGYTIVGLVPFINLYRLVCLAVTTEPSLLPRLQVTARQTAPQSSRQRGGLHRPPFDVRCPSTHVQWIFGLVPDGARPFDPLAPAHPRLAVIY